MMRKKPIPPRDVPDWFLETVRVMWDVEQGRRNMETQLRYGLLLKDLEPALHEEMQYVLNSLGAVKISLSVMDITARRVLSDLTKPEPLTDRLAAAG